MDEDERKKVLKGKDIDKIAAACNRYPTMNLTHSFGERTQEEVELIVELERDDDLDNDKVISNYFPG